MTLEEHLQGVTSVAIAGHVKPDGDCVGSTLAVYNYIRTYYPKIQADIFLEPIPNIFKFLSCSQDINSAYDDRPPYDLFVALDCGDERRLGRAVGYFREAAKTFCIDHHISNDSFADVNYIFPGASSTCELVFELMEEARITREIAECIYVGLVHDTGVFQYSCTSAKTMNIAGRLMEKGINFPEIVNKTYFEKTYEQNRILGQALIDSRRYLDDRCIASVITAEQMQQYHAQPKHLEGIVQQLRATKGVEVAIFIYENEDHTFKVSMRSGSKVNVSKLLMKYGGGGHERAAGATVEQAPDEMLALLLKDIEAELD